jgi:ArsR family transcriptional regulator, arsenate/arsenite/antimonite-responsive transcriptional repressor
MHRRTLLRLYPKSIPKHPDVPRVPHPLPTDLAPVGQWFHAFSDPTRLALLALLSQRQRCASEMRRILDVPPSRVSFHLKVLKHSGLISELRDGRRRYFSLRPETLERMIACIEIVQPGKHIGTCPLACCQ